MKNETMFFAIRKNNEAYGLYALTQDEGGLIVGDDKEYFMKATKDAWEYFNEYSEGYFYEMFYLRPVVTQ